ncbi:MAG TPA: hypothetical protein PKY59_03425 [Pyrinomonadaceae bacterium]|nr:hypothetical protein [Pyrinomonadaceae bacterium]
MRNQLASIALTVLVVFVFSFQTFAQGKTDGFNLSISIENTDFRLSRQPKIKVTLENKTGSTIYLRDSEPIWLNFESFDTPDFGCRRSDCFVAFAVFKDKHIENNKSIEAEFDLRDFYWKDSISSSINFKKPKNFFETVNFGKYRFYAFVRVPPNDSTFEESKFVGLKSNEIKVSM